MTENDKSVTLNPYFQGLQWGFLVLAVGILLFQYAFNRSLWLDEASLALNIQERDMQGILRPLDYDQAAPLGFLVIVEALTNVIGISEYSLRLIPLIAGLLTIGLLIWVCRMIAPSALPLALGLLATSAIHIDYATEFKQYALDATLALWYLGLSVQISRQRHPKHIALAMLTGVVAVWFSHAIIFMLAGCGLVLWLDAIRQRNWRTFGHLTLMGIAQVISFVLVYVVSYQAVLHSTPLADFMNNFWEDYFLHATPYSVFWFIFHTFTYLAGIGQLVLIVLVFYGFLLGLLRIGWRVAGFIFVPVILMCGASFLDLYPLSDRFLLYIFAPLMIIIALGWHSLIQNIAKKNPRVGVGLLLILTALLLIRIPAPIYKDDVRGAFEWLESVRQPDDPVYAIILTGRTGKYYGYESEHFPAPIPTDERVWIVIDRPLSHPQVGLNVTHVVYSFIGRYGIYVMCIPTINKPCPTNLGNSS